MKYENYKYVLVLSDKVVGVTSETKTIITADVMCAKKDIEIGTTEELVKSKVIKDLHKEKVEYIEDIPNWWFSSSAEM